MSVSQEKYDELLSKYKNLNSDYNDLKERYNRLDLELDSANFKIRKELEPRIQEEKRAYDRWVSSPQT